MCVYQRGLLDEYEIKSLSWELVFTSDSLHQHIFSDSVYSTKHLNCETSLFLH